jgi:putative membrane protein
MSDLLANIYPWVKSLHIIAVISWMAGLFYLPRLFVYHAEADARKTDLTDTLKVMEHKLLTIIMRPAMILSWIFGAILAFTPGVIDWSEFSWAYIKLLLVILMTAFHVWLSKRLKEFAQDTNSRTGRTYRLMNEVPTLLMIGIVVIVIVKPI